MQSLILEEQAKQIDPEIGSNPVQHVVGRNFSIDRPDTCRFFEHEKDVLAGYLFAQDYEMREGSD